MYSKLEKFVLFGAGRVGAGVPNYWANRVVAVIDNDEKKQGCLFCDIPIISVQQYMERYREYTILISVYSKHYFDIVHQLENLGIHNYFTMPPVIYGYPKTKELVEYIWKKYDYKKIVFDTNNPLSRDMYCLLPSKNVEVSYWGQDSEIKNVENDRVAFILCEPEINRRYNIEDLKKKMWVDIFDFYDFLPSQKDLKRFKNIYLGKSCFIIGNGPSLQKEDLERLMQKSIICFASNGIYNIYNQTKWRPDYYVISDVGVITKFEVGISSLAPEQCFLTNTRYIDIKKQENINYFSYKNLLKKNELEFSNDISKYIVCGKTVSYTMLQIACYMGFSMVYLLGVDWTGGKGTGVERYDFYDKDIPQIRTTSYNIIAEEKYAYESAKSYADSHGIAIKNATRGGELEVFERVDFDKLMEEWNE